MHDRRAKRLPLLGALILLTIVMAIIGSIVVLLIRIPDHSPSAAERIAAKIEKQ